MHLRCFVLGLLVVDGGDAFLGPSSSGHERTVSRTGRRQETRQEAPPAPIIEDGPYGILMVSAFRLAMASQAGWQSSAPFIGGAPGESFAGLCDIARRLFATSKEDTSERVQNVLRSFPTSPQLLQNNKLSCELLGGFTPLLTGASKTYDTHRKTKIYEGALCIQ